MQSQTIKSLVEQRLKEQNILQDGQVLSEAFWDTIKKGVGNAWDTAKYGLSKAGSATSKSQGQAAQKQLSGDFKNAPSHFGEALKQLRTKLDSLGFPNMKSQEAFVASSMEIAWFYEALAHPITGLMDDPQTAQQLVVTLRKLVQYYLDYALADVYKHFKQEESQLQEAEHPNPLSGTKDSKTIQGLSSKKFPAFMSYLGSMAGMGVLMSNPAFQALAKEVWDGVLQRVKGSGVVNVQQIIDTQVDQVITPQAIQKVAGKGAKTVGKGTKGLGPYEPMTPHTKGGVVGRGHEIPNRQSLGANNEPPPMSGAGQPPTKLKPLGQAPAGDKGPPSVDNPPPPFKGDRLPTSAVEPSVPNVPGVAPSTGISALNTPDKIYSKLQSLGINPNAKLNALRTSGIPQNLDPRRLGELAAEIGKNRSDLTFDDVIKSFRGKNGEMQLPWWLKLALKNAKPIAPIRTEGFAAQVGQVGQAAKAALTPENIKKMFKDALKKAIVGAVGGAAIAGGAAAAGISGLAAGLLGPIGAAAGAASGLVKLIRMKGLKSSRASVLNAILQELDDIDILKLRPRIISPSASKTSQSLPGDAIPPAEREPTNADSPRAKDRRAMVRPQSPQIPSLKVLGPAGDQDTFADRPYQKGLKQPMQQKQISSKPRPKELGMAKRVSSLQTGKVSKGLPSGSDRNPTLVKQKPSKKRQSKPAARAQTVAATQPQKQPQRKQKPKKILQRGRMEQLNETLIRQDNDVYKRWQQMIFPTNQ